MASPGGRSGTATSLIVPAALGAIALHLVLRAAYPSAADYPLYPVVLGGGPPLCAGIARKAVRGEVGADLLGGISVVVAAVMGQWLVAAILVLMLSGGAALEAFAQGSVRHGG